MSSTNLSREYRLVRLTREELLVQCKEDDYEHWGAPILTAEQWQEKEARQRETRFSRDRITFWALVPKRSASDTFDTDTDLIVGEDPICCHCKVHLFDCVFRSSEGQVKTGYSHQIGSVFTSPAYRKRGLASFFLLSLAKRLEQIPNTYASALYSDIGPHFYDRLGWKCYPSKEATIAVSSTKAIPDALKASGEKLFLNDRLDHVLERDNKKMQETLDSDSFNEEAFAILSSRDMLEWKLCTGPVYARAAGLDQVPTQCGVYVDDAAFVTWFHLFKEATLYILHARLPEGSIDTALYLLQSAQEEARRYGLTSVKLWSPPSILQSKDVTSNLDIDFHDRDRSLSSVMFFPQPTADRPSPEWLFNEKYAWV